MTNPKVTPEKPVKPLETPEHLQETVKPEVKN